MTNLSAMQPNRKPAGEHLREWRSKRRMSQLELASEAEISARHLSFLETGPDLAFKANTIGYPVIADRDRLHA